MTTRRDFIGGLTGVAFVGCELMHATNEGYAGHAADEVPACGHFVLPKLCFSLSSARMSITHQ